MGKVVDSSILIAAERGELDLATALRQHPDESFAIAAITASEVLHGVHRVKASKRALMADFVEAMLQTFPVLPFDLGCARVHSRLWAEAASRGNMLAGNDLMIAATALVYDSEVVTRDMRSFPRIPGLRVVHW